MRIGKASIGLILATGVCLAALLAHPAAAQESTAMKQVGMVRTGAGTFTMDVEGADIRTVLKAISEFSGRNIVIGKDVKASVKVSLRNVGWQDALRRFEALMHVARESEVVEVVAEQQPILGS